MGGVKSHAISIHSLHTEGDLLTGGEGKRIFSFQSTPSVWRETTSPFCISTFSPFQSTPSVWRETLRKAFILTGEKHFNPLPPYGGRPTAKPQHFFRSGISIHSLRMEGDNRIKHKPHLGIIISIHSLRMEGDEPQTVPIPVLWRISIHSLRMEGDYDNTRRTGDTHHFNPLPPHGGRPLVYLR